jgi:hypothetical protein
MGHAVVLGVLFLLSVIGVIVSMIALVFKDTGSIARVIAQVTSGRWILTVLAGVAFAFLVAGITMVIIATKTQFKPETIVAMFSSVLLVIQGVYKDYFNRSRDDRENGSAAESPEAPEAPEVPVKPQAKGPPKFPTPLQ